MINFTLFLIFSTIGGIVGSKLKLPLGYMIGAMVFVGFFNSIRDLTFGGLSEVLFLLQILLGAMLGATFIDFKKDYIRQVGITVSLIFFGIALIIIIISAILVFIFNFNLTVAILSSAPGAIYEMAMIADALGVEAPVVVLAHFTRILIIMSLFSLLMKFLYRKSTNKGDQKIS
ncbi:AbrB family transcriptional regulator [Anaerobacillus sp. MEB173]|uniref:AbrB family transcriptional regulator n=1 Tax=Anaerobacillus sp. MEB173 TaxID=3383345 RepID=UPI003F8F744D